MLYMVTVTIHMVHIPQMLAYIPYMDAMIVYIYDKIDMEPIVFSRMRQVSHVFLGE